VGKAEGHIVFGAEIGFAESADGRVWKKHPEPALEPGPAGAWDSHHVFYPTVLRLDEELWMYYHGNDAVINHCSIGLASSQDGVAWRRHPENPVMSLGEDDELGFINIACPNVVRTQDGFAMIYVRERPRKDGTGPITDIALARSRDGKRWKPCSMVIDLEREGLCISYPSLLEVEGRYLLWAWAFTHDPDHQDRNDLRLYGSPDLERWEPLWETGWVNTWTDNAFTRRAFIPRIFQAGERRYFMFYPIRFQRGACDTGLAIARI
jgi:predicted GH43/DUF377 family glycosyl hydrolase